MRHRNVSSHRWARPRHEPRSAKIRGAHRLLVAPAHRTQLTSDRPAKAIPAGTDIPASGTTNITVGFQAQPWNPIVACRLGRQGLPRADRCPQRPKVADSYPRVIPWTPTQAQAMSAARTILVTGAGSGIGKTVTVRTLDAGWKVAHSGCNDRRAHRAAVARGLRRQLQRRHVLRRAAFWHMRR